MKKLFVAAAVLLAFTACQNKQQGTAAENTETAGTELAEKAAPAVAYVQIDSLMLDYKLAEELRNTFQAKANKADRDVNAKLQKLEKDRVDAQEQKPQGLGTRTNAEEKKQQLRQRRR